MGRGKIQWGSFTTPLYFTSGVVNTCESTHLAAPQPAPPPAPSSSSRVSTGGKDSTKSLSRTGVKDNAPGFDTHDCHGSLINV